MVGALIAGLLMKKSGVGMYPMLIANAYEEDQHQLTVPGSKEVKLNRTGAYGIYFVSSWQDSLQMQPPALACSLTSHSTGEEVDAVTDFVETNRYWSNKEGISGVLVMSITVDNPDTYTFECRFQDGSLQPKITIALGPNYYWEFLRVAWKIALPLFGGIGVLCGSILLALLFVIVVAFKRAGVNHD